MIHPLHFRDMQNKALFFLLWCQLAGTSSQLICGNILYCCGPIHLLLHTPLRLRPAVSGTAPQVVYMYLF